MKKDRPEHDIKRFTSSPIPKGCRRIDFDISATIYIQVTTPIASSSKSESDLNY